MLQNQKGKENICIENKLELVKAFIFIYLFMFLL